MKQQVVIIGGGTTFDSYKDYISYLKHGEVTLDRLRPSVDWKETLSDKLGSSFDVILPKMPNKTNAQYKEWKIWFERVIPLLNEKIILIGHSLGAAFLTKYLSQNTVPKKIVATILVAPPFKDSEGKESLAQFSPHVMTRFSKQSQRIYLIQSKDDPVVGFDNLEKYKQALPKAEAIIFKDRGHFNQKTFPEIVKLIKLL